MEKIKIGVIGGTGYTGIELLKILSNHEMIDINFIGANSNHGLYADDVIPNIRLSKKLKIKKNSEIFKLKNLDLIFSCLPSGGLNTIYSKIKKLKTRIIDLSGDFRLKGQIHDKWYEKRRVKDSYNDFQYILPEVNQFKMNKNKNISNPGCYATSILLGLCPLGSILKKSDNIIVDTKSGLSGAGKSGNIQHSFTESSENLSTYNVGNHRHAPEIEQLIFKEYKKNISIIMVPHLLPIKRGIMSNIYISRNKHFNLKETIKIYKNYYYNSKFVKILESGLPKISDVQNTNLCHIGIKTFSKNNTLLISSVIDNLGKGAAGQAVQNMNILFDFDETLGL